MVIDPTQFQVISLCDYTGKMVEDWAAAGYECWCVDFQHSIRKDRVRGNVHFVWGDARSWVPISRKRIAFVATFPICTHMTVAGARDFKKKGLRLLTDSLDLFNSCYQAAAWSLAPFLVENPVGVLSTHFREANYLFNPCDFGGYCDDPKEDAYTKKTCLWTGNDFVMPEHKWVEPVDGSRMHKLPPGPQRENLRSATPRGFARAVYLANAPHLRVA
jgi:hypothetical protein